MIFKISIIFIVKECSDLQSIVLNSFTDIKIPTQCVQKYILTYFTYFTYLLHLLHEAESFLGS